MVILAGPSGGAGRHYNRDSMLQSIAGGSGKSQPKWGNSISKKSRFSGHINKDPLTLSGGLGNSSIVHKNSQSVNKLPP